MLSNAQLAEVDRIIMKQDTLWRLLDTLYRPILFEDAPEPEDGESDDG